MANYCKVILLVICAVLLQGCAHKTIDSVERVTDTTYIVKTDSVRLSDTIHVEQMVAVVDSIVDNTTTYVVVDTAGHVITKYVYRDRGVYHNKDALTASNHVTASQQKQTQSEKRATDTLSKSVVKVEKPPTIGSYIKAIMLVFIAIAVIYYLNIYQKNK